MSVCSEFGDFRKLPSEVFNHLLMYLRWDTCAIRELGQNWRRVVDLTFGAQSEYNKLKYAVKVHGKVVPQRYLDIVNDIDLSNPNIFAYYHRYMTPDNIVSSCSMFKVLIRNAPVYLMYIDNDTLRVILQQDIKYKINMTLLLNYKFDSKTYELLAQYMKRVGITIPITKVHDVGFIRALVKYNHCPDLSQIKFVHYANGKLYITSYRIFSDINYFTIQEFVDEFPQVTLGPENFTNRGGDTIRALNRYCKAKYGIEVIEHPTHLGLDISEIISEPPTQSTALTLKSRGILTKENCKNFVYEHFSEVWYDDNTTMEVIQHDIQHYKLTDIPDNVLLRARFAIGSEYEEKQIQKIIELKKGNDFIRKIFS